MKMDEKQKLFRTIRIILQLGCLVYVVLILAVCCLYFALL